MYLFVCAMEKGDLKYEISEIIRNKTIIDQATWIMGENGSDYDISENPVVIGSLASLLKNKEQDVLLAKVRGMDNVNLFKQYLQTKKEQKHNCEYFVLQLVA